MLHRTHRHRTKRAFTLIEATVVVVVASLVVASAASGLMSIKTKLDHDQGLRTAVETVREARDVAVRFGGPVIVRHKDSVGPVPAHLSVEVYSGGDCKKTGPFGVTNEAVPDPVEVKMITTEPASRMLGSGPIKGICFKARGGAIFQNSGSGEVYIKKQLSVELGGYNNILLSVRDTGEVFLSNAGEDGGTPGAHLHYEGTPIGVPGVVAVDPGAVVGKNPSLAVIRPEGGGGGGADIATTTGGGVPKEGDCLGLTFTVRAHDTHDPTSALLRITDTTTAYVGTRDCSLSLPIGCIKTPGLVATDPYSLGCLFPAPYDDPYYYGSFYNGWAKGASVSLTAPKQGFLLTSRQVADQICNATFPGTRMVEFHDSTTGGWGMRVVKGTNLNVGQEFWTAIDDQNANPWNYP